MAVKQRDYGLCTWYFKEVRLQGVENLLYVSIAKPLEIVQYGRAERFIFHATDLQLSPSFAIVIYRVQQLGMGSNATIQENIDCVLQVLQAYNVSACIIGEIALNYYTYHEWYM